MRVIFILNKKLKKKRNSRDAFHLCIQNPPRSEISSTVNDDVIQMLKNCDLLSVVMLCFSFAQDEVTKIGSDGLELIVEKVLLYLHLLALSSQRSELKQHKLLDPFSFSNHRRITDNFTKTNVMVIHTQL